MYVIVQKNCCLGEVSQENIFLKKKNISGTCELSFDVGNYAVIF